MQGSLKICCKWTAFALVALGMIATPHAFCLSIAPPGLDFKDDAKSVCANVEITEDENKPQMGYLTRQGFEDFLNKVSRMPQLEELRIGISRVSGNGVDIAAERFIGLTNLTDLAISGCDDDRLVRISAISNWWSLPIKSLELSSVVVPDPRSIGRFRLLECLRTSLHEIVQAAPVALESLTVRDAYFQDALDVSRFPFLEYLRVYNVRCTGIFGIGSLGGLKDLRLEGGPIVYLDELARCSKLDTLHMANMDDAYFLDFAELGKLPLENMRLEGIPVRAIRGLEKCPLEDLVVQRAQLREWSDICRLPKLEKIDVTFTAITNADLAVITNLFPKIKTIWYSSNKNPLALFELDDKTGQFLPVGVSEGPEAGSGEQ